MGSLNRHLAPLRALRKGAVGLVLLLLCVASNATAQSYQAGLAAVDAGDIERAVEIWQDIIESNAPDRAQAEYALALLYETGRAVAWDESRAAELYAASGLPEALTNLGLMYAEGRGVDFDPAAAADLWQQAADVGHAFAQFNLGLAYYGRNGVPKDALKALELIHEAGEGGLAEAQWAVCQFYERGVGVPVDVEEAIRWCALAAEQGQLQAVDAVQRLSLQQREAQSESPAPQITAPDLPSDDPDNVDLSLEVPPVLDENDPANEFVTQAPQPPSQPPSQPLVTQPPQPDSEDQQASTQRQPGEPTDPLLLLGSEFDEFADLLTPVEPDETASPEQSATGEPSGRILPDDSDEIAALIESAGPVLPELPALDIEEQPDPGSALQEEADTRGVPLSLQEMVDGTLASEPAIVEEVPPLPSNRPTITYEIPAIIDGPVYAVWLGTGKDAEEASAIYDKVMDAAPDILGIMQAAFQNDVLRVEQTGFGQDTSVVRLLFGPLPGKDYAWQICNLLKSKRSSTFCFPVEVEG